VSRLPTVLAAFVLFSGSLFAQPFPPHLEVTGEAQVRRPPDQAVVTLGVDSWASDLVAARKDNDARMARLLAVPGKFAIEAREVKTDFASIEPQYQRGDQGQVLSIGGYRVTKLVTVTVKELSVVEAFVAAALGAGANRLDRVEFGLANPAQVRDQALVLAVRDASSRAEALARELGVQVGKPLMISDQNNPGPPGLGYKMAFAERGGAGGDTFAPGEMVVGAQVSLWFELKD